LPLAHPGNVSGLQTTPTAITRSSSRLGGSGSFAGMFGVARSDFDEQRILSNLQVNAQF